MKRFPALSFLLLAAMVSPMQCLAQTGFVVNLKQQIQSAVQPVQKLNLLLQLCEQRESMSADTLAKYATLAKELALSRNNREAAILSDFYIGFSLQTRGLVDSALQLADKYLQELPPGQYDLRKRFYYLKAGSLIRGSRYQDGIGTTYTLLQQAEEHNDTLMLMIARNSIAWACMEMNSLDEAAANLQKGIKMYNGNERYEKVFGVACSNLAAVYNSLGRYDSAEYFINQAIAAERHTESLNYLANALNIQADGYTLTGKKELAEAPLTEAINIRKRIGDPYYLVSDMYQLALFYTRSGKALKGIELCKEGILLARKNHLIGKLPILYEALAESYKSAGDIAAYGNTLERLIEIKDSVYQSSASEAMAGLKAKYEVTRQENIIIRQKLDIIRQNYLIYGAGLLLLFAIVMSVVLFQNYRKKQRTRMEYLMQQEKITAAAAIREAEESERKRIAADLHDNLGAYAASIASNIDHIHMEGKDAGITAMQQLRSNSREMVSQLNDTIWVLNKDALSLTAISDRIKSFIQRLGASHPEIRMEVEEDITNDVLLSPVQAFHLFRMMQEALANAVKHSGGDEIILFITGTATTLSIRIEDNGRGMDANGDIAREGNGLQNMKTRGEEGGWFVQWQSNKPRGTVVSIMPATTN